MCMHHVWINTSIYKILELTNIDIDTKLCSEEFKFASLFYGWNISLNNLIKKIIVVSKHALLQKLVQKFMFEKKKQEL